MIGLVINILGPAVAMAFLDASKWPHMVSGNFNSHHKCLGFWPISKRGNNPFGKAIYH